MGRGSVPDKGWRTERRIDFTQGFAYPARNDAESERFENFELDRDGTLIGRLGIFQHNANDLGTNTVNGWGRQNFGTVLTDTLVITKPGTTWYSFAGPYGQPGAWVSFTSPQDPLNDPVITEALTLLDETPIMAFTNKNFSSILMWTGTGATTAIAGSPGQCTILRLSGGRLYASGQPSHPSRVYYSDQNDPTSWPATNFFDILPNRGPVTAMENVSGTTLTIWTDRSIQGVYGDPAPNSGFVVQVLQDGIGCDTPRGVSTLGSLTVFGWRGNMYAFTGAVQDLTEMLRAITTVPLNTPLPGYGAQVFTTTGLMADYGAASTFSYSGNIIAGQSFADDDITEDPYIAPANINNATLASRAQSWCTVTPFYIFWRPTMNTGSDGTPTSDLPSILYVLDRERGGWMSVWNYSSNGGTFGQANPFEATVFAVDNYLFMGGGDGNVYIQPVRTVDQANILGTFEAPVFTQDAGNVDVIAAQRSRLSEQGDPLLLKQLRGFRATGQCTAGSMSVTIRILKPDSTFAVMVNNTGLSLPVELVPDMSVLTDYYLIQTEVSASQLWLRGYGLEWRPRLVTGRYAL